MGEPNNDDPTIKELYAIFRIPEEQYIVTVKLKIIYAWIQPEAGEESFERLKQLRAALKRMSNQRKIDAILRMAEHAMMLRNGRYAPSEARVPVKRQDYISGWSPW